MKGYGAKIRLFAILKYDTQRGLAKELGISPHQLNNYVKEKRKPNSAMLYKFIQAGLNIHWLLAPRVNESELYRRKIFNDRIIKENR